MADPFPRCRQCGESLRLTEDGYVCDALGCGAVLSVEIGKELAMLQRCIVTHTMPGTDYPKYLIVLSEQGCECAIVFNHILDHKQVAGNMEVVSAGYCHLLRGNVSNVSVWGESTTLKIESRGDEDAVAILRYLSPQE